MLKERVELLGRDGPFKTWICRAIYAAAILYFANTFLAFNDPEFGFTPLAKFGERFQTTQTKKLAGTVHYVGSEIGYDGQLYAQMALYPSLQDPDLPKAIDNFPYRARRILFSWTAWAIGLGEPDRVVQAYCFQGGIFWFALALLLCHWLPPINYQNAIRYIAILYSAGMIQSITFALIDGPSLFLIACGVYLIERNKNWMGVAVLGLSGLGKETNVFAAAALLPKSIFSRGALLAAAPKLALCVLPIILWFTYVYAILDPTSSGTIGASNFTWPLAGWARKWQFIYTQAKEIGIFHRLVVLNVFASVSITLQCAYILLKPKPDNHLWRIGFVFSVLVLFLGDLVWEGYPGAIVRVALPVTLVFNLILPRRASTIPLLLLANLSVITSFQDFEAPVVSQKFSVAGPSSLIINPTTSQRLNIVFEENWHITENDRSKIWRWSPGDSSISFVNPHAGSLSAQFEFVLKTIQERNVKIELNGEIIWQRDAKGGYSEKLAVPMTLKPGQNEIRIYSERPPDILPPDERSLSFALYEFKLRLVGLDPE